MPMYELWWLVGLIPVLQLMAMRGRESQKRWIVGTFAVLPLISIIAHLATTNWVYQTEWSSANLSPLLLGLAVVGGSYDTHPATALLRRRVQFFLPILAIFFALQSPHSLSFDASHIPITPMRLTLLASGLVYFHGLFVHRRVRFIVAGTGCFTTLFLGSNPSDINENMTSAGEMTWNLFGRLLPSSTLVWGIISVSAAFVLLGIGTALSLLKPPKIRGDQTS